jgi:hypothetical protein
MKNLRFPQLLIAGLALGLVAAVQGADETSTIKFSDPKKPGTLRVQVARGDVRIKGADVQEISVRSDATPVTRTPRKDGLRVLTASTGFTLSEKDNVVTLDTMADGWHGGGSSDFSLTVPRNTNVVVTNSWGGGDIRVSNLSGDLEVECMHGEVHLDSVSGGALVSTMNGEIHASFAQLQPNKPLSFTSMNGEVLLRLPTEAKANVRLRTQNGSILTDFEENALVTKVESVARTSVKTVRAGTRTPSKPGVLPQEARDAIADAARVGAEAAREAAQAMREAAQAAREGAEAARAAEVARADAQRAGEPVAPLPPKPPKFPSITPTGGKLVTGTLNGGGAEINVSTMNGNVTLRKLAQKN